MCLIVVKPAGICLPKHKKMRQWFATHPDGFGLAFLHNGQVRILKGAMGTKQMCRLVAKMETYLGETSSTDIDVILHFRQATQGQKTPANCHPFPITKKQDDLASLDVLTGCAVVHNGILWDYLATDYTAFGIEGYCNWDGKWADPTEQKTDTQEFIEDYLVDLGDSLWEPAVQKLIEAYTQSKFAFLSSEGISLIGEFIAENGYWYSNGGYKPSVKPVSASKIVFNMPSAPIDKELADGGICCDGCEEFCSSLYARFDNKDSLVCFQCFQRFYGRRPVKEEQIC